MLKFIKIHWFGLILSLLGVLYLWLVILVVLSPRQDKLNRGFIPCTKAMMTDFSACEKGKLWCLMKAVFSNTLCDAGVVLSGVENWAKNKQKTPWANYLFEPEVDKEPNQHPELTKFYEQNKNIRADMAKLYKASLELEREKDEKAKPQE